MKRWFFKVRTKNEKVQVFSATSKHLNGAIRKIYQQYDVDEILSIL